MGNNSTNGSAVPVQISELTNARAIVSADYDSYALKTDGTVFAWGGNPSGQLGNGNTPETSKKSPQTNPLFDTTLTLPNRQIVTPDQLDGQTVINHSVRWKDLLVSLQIMGLPNHGPQSYLEIVGNHSTVLSESNVSTFGRFIKGQEKYD